MEKNKEVLSPELIPDAGEETGHNAAPDQIPEAESDPKLPDAIGKKHRRPALKQLVVLSLLCAIIILMGLTPLGLIPLGFINVTILCVPVVVGTLLLGLPSGLVLGGAFGLVSFYSALVKPSTLVAAIMAKSPVLVFLLCILPRLCVPVAAWAMNRLLEKQQDKPGTTFLTSAAIGALFNALSFLVVPGWLKDCGISDAVATTLTVLIGFALNMGIGYAVFRLLGARGRTISISAVAGSLTNTVLYLGMMLFFYILLGIESTKVLALIGGTALLAGSAEAAVAGILCTPIVTALRKLKK